MSDSAASDHLEDMEPAADAAPAPTGASSDTSPGASADAQGNGGDARRGRVSLQSLVDRGLPAHPITDFDDLYRSLNSSYQDAKQEREERESELFAVVDELVVSLEAGLREAESQLQRLEFLRERFRSLGDFGLAGLDRVESGIEKLQAYRDRLVDALRNPELEEARVRLTERIEEERRRLQGQLHHDCTRDQVDEAMTALLSALATGDPTWAFEAIDEFEDDIREWRRFHHLPAVVRFWETMAERLAELDPRNAEHAAAKAAELEREITERESRDKASEEAKRLALEVREAVATLAEMGPEETKVQMRIWLGRLRHYQDDFDLDDQAKKELYLTFGTINRARKEMQVQGFIDALNRSFQTDWQQYVRDAEMRMESARTQDRLDREEDERIEHEKEERARLSAEERSRSEARLTEFTEILQELGQGAGWEADPDTWEDIQEMLTSALDEGGCQSEEFLEAARPFASLMQGSEFRRLRRSLAKRDLDFDQVQWIESDGDEGPEVELFRDLMPRYEGKTVAIVGGLPREEVRRRVEEGLSLKEARWYEYYRHHCDQEQAENAIRSGTVDLVVLLVRYAGHKINEIRDVCRQANVECRVIDRGCGVTSLLRGLA